VRDTPIFAIACARNAIYFAKTNNAFTANAIACAEKATVFAQKASALYAFARYFRGSRIVG